MSITISIKDYPDENWNQRLLDNKFDTIYQTKEYAEFRITNIHRSYQK